MRMKTLLALLLALCLCLAPVSALASGEDADPAGDAADTAPAEDAEEPAEEMPESLFVGGTMPDFTFTAYDGTAYTLSEVLKEKDMVLINLWGTWCPWCVREFPFMETAYEQYKDSIEIFAMTDSPDDTDEVVADFAQENGLTFPMGQDPIGMADLFDVSGYPTSVIVDRFGVICAVESGAVTDEEGFPLAFEPYLGEEYTESDVRYDGFPKGPHAEPTVEPEDPEDLAAALLGESAVEVAVVNPEDDEYNWPMVVSKDAGAVSEDGSAGCVTGSNTGTDYSYAGLDLTFQCAEGDAFAVDYKVSSEEDYDFAVIYLDDEPVKLLSGEWDWRTYACVLEEGEHTVTLAYEKDEMESGGDDAAWFSNFRVVTGDDVDAALAAMPQYPYAEQTDIVVDDPDAKEIVFDDPADILDEYMMPDAQYFIVPGEFTVRATLSEDCDPEATYIVNVYDNSGDLAANCVDGDGYAYTAVGVDSVEETGYSYGYVTIDAEEDYDVVFVFADEANVNAFVQEVLDEYEDEDPVLSWTYADGTEPSTDEVAAAADDAPEGYTNYTLVFTDQNDDPVEGVIANVCDDSTCTPMTSDADGLIEFTYPTFAYHIQVIKVPDGYEYDTSEELYLEEDQDMVFFDLEKAE